MGYKFLFCDMGPISPLCRVKDLIAAFWPYYDLVSDALATKTYHGGCEKDSKQCIYFYLGIVFICLPSLFVIAFMSWYGVRKRYILMYGLFYPVWAPFKRVTLIIGNGLNCFVDGENDEAAQNISSEIALPEVLLESVPQVR